MRYRAGLTIVELLISLAIVAALSALALPAMRQFVETQRAIAVVNQLIATVQYARSAAITASATVTLCPSGDGARCGSRDAWHAGSLVFEDLDGNGRRGQLERVLRHFPALPAGSRVYWTSFRNRSYLSFTATGFTAWQNGHFRYCPRDADPRHIRDVVINPQGRVRRASDRDGDGVVEDTEGRPVRCP